MTGKTIKCYACNASLDVPDGLNKIFCTYCGTQNLLTDILEIPGLTLLCLNCNTKNKEENIYCDKCGSNLQAECPYCFQMHPIGKEFCPKTGRNIKNFQKSIRVWEFETGEQILCSPSVCEGLVYFSSDKFYCLDAKNGRKVWEFNMKGGRTFSSPCVWKGFVYFGSDKLYCLDAKNGRKVWEFESECEIKSSPCIEEGLLYIYLQHKHPYNIEGYIYCLSPENGRKIWRFQGFNDNYGVISPCVSEGLLYFVRECDLVGHNPSKLTCVNAKTARIVWEIKVNVDTFIRSRPCVANNRVYFGCDRYNFNCLDAKTGKKIWEFKQTDMVRSSPCVTDGLIYFGGDKFYCLNAETGKKVWEFEKPSQTSPCVTDGLVYFGGDKFYCLNAKTGKKIWELDTEFTVFSSPYMYDGFIYFGDKCKLCCLDTGKRGITAGNSLVWEPVT